MKFIKDSELEREFDDLISSLERGEMREQQINLSKQIAICLNRHENGIYQAGTGIGKSFAYLIPAILSERKMVISTATKQLSSQIANKDLKILKDVLFPNLKYQEVQGAGNYICTKNFDKFFFSDEKNPEINLYIGVDKTYDEVKDLPDEEILPELKVNGFARDKFKQRIKDIKFLYYIKDQWDKLEKQEITQEEFRKMSLDCSASCLREISCEHSKCIEKKTGMCEFLKNKTCPYRQLMNNLDEQDIVVTNHAYVGANIGISNNNSLFRGRDLWIADEGHELEQYLVKSFSNEISTRTLRKLYDKLFYPGIEQKLFKAIQDSFDYGTFEDFKNNYKILDKEILNLIDTLRSYSNMMNLSEENKDKELPESVFVGLKSIIKTISEKSKSLLENMIVVYAESKQISDAYYELASAEVEISDISFEGRDSYIFWLEFRKGQLESENDVVLHATNIKVGEKLQAFLGSLDVSKVRNKNIEINENEINLITLSATMKIGQSFEEFKNLISADKSKKKYNTYDAGTVFDYNSQGILYIPSDIPDVKNDREVHFKKFAYETVRLINSSNGGALVLCTTSAEADQIYELLEKLFGNKLHIFNYKESRNKDVIVEKFREDRDSVLVGTRGFFQGIDVQGVSLRLVCINKIPFPTPNCVSEAKSRLYQSEGKNAFRLTSIVPATQTLLQATGRLIRHTTDNGVVMIMDNRINQAPGWLIPLITSIPDFYRTNKFEDVDEFFRKMKQIL